MLSQLTYAEYAVVLVAVRKDPKAGSVWSRNGRKANSSSVQAMLLPPWTRVDATPLSTGRPSTADDILVQLNAEPNKMGVSEGNITS